MRGFYMFVRGALYVPYKLVFPTKVIGRDNVPTGKNYISVGNHLSWADTPNIGINIKGYRHFIAKKEIGDNRFIRWLALHLGVIFIDRGTADLGAVKKILRALKAGENVSLFPEGTRNKENTELQEIKAGAAMFAIKGNAVIVPMMIYRKTHAFRKNWLYVAPELDLSAFAGRKLDGETMAAAVELLSERMHEAKAYLDDYVEHKRWKEIKAAKKADKKRLKAAKRNKAVPAEPATETQAGTENTAERAEALPTSETAAGKTLPADETPVMTETPAGAQIAERADGDGGAV